MNPDIFHLSPAGWALAILCGMIVGFAKTGIAGTGILIVPLMAYLFPAKESVGILLPMLVIGDIFTVTYYRRHAVWKHVLRALPWAILGILLGYATGKLFTLSNHTMKQEIGVIVLLVLAMGEWVRRQGDTVTERLPHRWWFAAGLGLLGGFLTMTANAAGPVWVVYLLAMELPKEAFLGTSGWMFLILNTFKIPFQWDLGSINSQSLFFNLEMFPAITAGALIGIATVKRLPQRVFDLLVRLLAAVAALRLLWG